MHASRPLKRPRPGAKTLVGVAKPKNITHKVGVTSVLDGHDTNSVELTGGGTEVDVGTIVVVDRGLGPVG